MPIIILTPSRQLWYHTPSTKRGPLHIVSLERFDKCLGHSIKRVSSHLSKNIRNIRFISHAFLNISTSKVFLSNKCFISEGRVPEDFTFETRTTFSSVFIAERNSSCNNCLYRDNRLGLTPYFRGTFCQRRFSYTRFC